MVWFGDSRLPGLFIYLFNVNFLWVVQLRYTITACYVNSTRGDASFYNDTHAIYAAFLLRTSASRLILVPRCISCYFHSTKSDFRRCIERSSSQNRRDTTFLKNDKVFSWNIKRIPIINIQLGLNPFCLKANSLISYVFPEEKL